MYATTATAAEKRRLYTHLPYTTTTYWIRIQPTQLDYRISFSNDRDGNRDSCSCPRVLAYTKVTQWHSTSVFSLPLSQKKRKDKKKNKIE